ncbi:DUF3310 domain-containing protein [Streptomyces althioticus]|uniref:DUF3310 domain-containing protein n=1 Tax=Streptomyces althioticus TaxID=83380 RepID=A0ABZ1YE99_9ACTN
MSKFKVGDRVVVVVDEAGKGYWLGRRGAVEVPEDGGKLSVGVFFDSGASASFAPEELEFEHVYDELSKKPADEAPLLALKVDTRPSDAVSHPSHYADGWSNGAEVIDITENLNFNRGNACKYLARAGKKGGPEKELEDLRKALWYVRREIERLGGVSE